MIPPVERRVVDAAWQVCDFASALQDDGAKEFAVWQAWWAGFWCGWLASLAAVLSGCLLALVVLA